MNDFTIILGNKNYSSWSLRSWLALKQTGVAFDEEVIPLYEAGSVTKLLAHSPAAKVPILKHGDLTVWDSLAICEYLAEQFPEACLWPTDTNERALARAISAEMHSGFVALRGDMSMDMRHSAPDHIPGPGVDADIMRISEIWNECRAKQADVGGGPFLFGQFTIADAMYAPVVSRLRTYSVDIAADSQAYMDAVWAHPWMVEWGKAAATEPAIEKYDAI